MNSPGTLDLVTLRHWGRRHGALGTWVVGTGAPGTVHPPPRTRISWGALLYSGNHYWDPLGPLLGHLLDHYWNTFGTPFGPRHALFWVISGPLRDPLLTLFGTHYWPFSDPLLITFRTQPILLKFWKVRFCRNEGFQEIGMVNQIIGMVNQCPP